jgi:hypothetical protein
MRLLCSPQGTGSEIGVVVEDDAIDVLASPA